LNVLLLLEENNKINWQTQDWKDRSCQC